MKKIPRNSPCPCGSGKKYKHCHLGKAEEYGLIDRRELEKIAGTHTDDPAKIIKKLDKAKKQLVSAVTHQVATWAPSNLAESLEYLTKCVQALHKEADDCYTLFALASLRFANAAQKGRDFGEDFAKRDLYGRIVVRSFFAEVEGVMYAAKRVVLWAVERKELKLLEEEMRIVDEVENDKFIPAIKSVQLTMGALVRLLDTDFELNYSCREWRDFKNLHSFRNSITHPKDKAAYLPLEDMQNLVYHGPKWFYDSLKGIELFACKKSCCLARPLTLEEIIKWQMIARKNGVDPSDALVL